MLKNGRRSAIKLSPRIIILPWSYEQGISLPRGGPKPHINAQQPAQQPPMPSEYGRRSKMMHLFRERYGPNHGIGNRGVLFVCECRERDRRMNALTDCRSKPAGVRDSNSEDPEPLLPVRQPRQCFRLQNRRANPGCSRSRARFEQKNVLPLWPVLGLSSRCPKRQGRRKSSHVPSFLVNFKLFSISSDTFFLLSAD